MNRIPINQYHRLKKGNVYTFRTFNMKGQKDRRGILILVTTTWVPQVKHKEGNFIEVTGKKLAGGMLVFEPLDNVSYWDGKPQTIISTTVGRGLFQIFSE